MDHIHLDEEPTTHPHIHPLESPREYYKFAGVIFAIFAASTLVSMLRGWDIERFLNDFMAVFFMTFAAFKFMNIEEFAVTYRSYDIITKRLPVWGYLFPFVEAGLGFAYLLSTDAWMLNLLTIIVTGIGSYGVWKELRKKSKIMCACLGTFIRLPLTKISLVENLAMLVMASAMLFI